ncbi:glycosidase [Labilibaculum sp. 44]|uniref:Glycosidase n=2 Tax=Labilibaculum euxinus TaxID=2686357 RepID=A0A7M4D1R1_9BACT|nr:glycosidase [Labilibaculum euxinus]MVB05795.1 glycosidase [Labilibaculum euxinus]
MNENKSIIKSGPMLNAYPDSIGGTLDDIIRFLNRNELEDVFQSFYILPSVFNTDLDRGFSVIDYNLNKMYASKENLIELKKMNIALKFDFVLNHSSVLSSQFQDILKKGENSKYKEFFIPWNKFWDGCGEISEEGYIQPDTEYIKDMFFRKPGLPILMVRMPDGKEVPYWNTFYQEVKYGKIDAQDLMKAFDIQYVSADRLAKIVNTAIDEGKKLAEIEFGKFDEYRKDTIDLLESRRKYLGQMDLNIKSPLVWEFYEDTLKKLSGYGAEIIRLDAFAYAPKEPELPNFLNDPGTWNLLGRVKDLADRYNLTLLPEIHSKYEDKMHEKLADQGYLTYDFFLPGLIIDAFERNTNEVLIRWIKDMLEKDIKVVNMLGCHDGIPLLDLKGLLTEEQIQVLIDTVVERGGFVKDLHGEKNMYYQVNATYYSALGENDAKLLLARAIQIFMPGKPQVWYLDLLAGKNDHEAVKNAGAGGHKEINRTNLKLEEAFNELGKDVVLKQLSLLKFRNSFPAFGFDAELKILESKPESLKLQWKNNGCIATFDANLKKYTFNIVATNEKGEVVYNF